MTSNRVAMAGRDVLISGGGIAGLTLAYWLERHGFQPTIIERAPRLRPEGYGIEFSGSGWDVLERMNLLPELHRHHMNLPFFGFKNSAGKTTSRLQMHVFFKAMQNKMVQIMRPDLQAILYEAINQTVPIRFGTTLQQIEQNSDKVLATFADGSQQAFDLVVGADGMHSNVRRLVFGDEAQFANYLGYYFATFNMPNRAEFEEGALIYFERNRQVIVYPTPRGDFTISLLWRAPNEGIVPSSQRKALLQHYFQGAGWIVPQLIESITEQTPVYLDSLTQIHMPRWSSGRVVLVGDAAHCLTLLSGMGSSVAMGGAYVLAEELSRHNDVQAACLAYERRVRPFVEKRQREALRFAKIFVPENRLEIFLSRLTMRLLFAPLLTPLVSRQIGNDNLLRGSF